MEADSDEVARACAEELAEERTIEVRGKVLEATEYRAVMSEAAQGDENKSEIADSAEEAGTTAGSSDSHNHA